MAIGKANASPTKAFFVRMLTRDISLNDCILDLVDNSIDGAWKLTNDHPSQLKIGDSLARFYIDIEISAESFRISDNCGGITLDNAVDYAFTFGRQESEPIEEFTVGVYGIGMKRAVFKLGQSIKIKSTYETEGELTAFEVPIEVNEWLQDQQSPWDFGIEDAEPAVEAGVEIHVVDLAPETKNKFEDPTYLGSLLEVLARDYLLPLMHGLTIRVNGTQVVGRRLELRTSDEFAPMRHVYEDDGVTVEILAGMVSAPPDDTAPEDPSRPDDVSGWYVLCNGRVVLAADRSVVTGWGRELPKWHNQYSGFVGVALFSAADAVLLPMTTTKRSVDISSAVYRRALVHMARPSRAWVDYTNARKQNLEDARRLESVAASLEISSIPTSAVVRLPSLGRPRTRERMANINYAVPLARLRSLASGLGDINLTYRDVGLRSFEYAYEMLVDEDE